ncbi:UDP-N-acetylmuramate dehydrogenase [Oceanospirillum maris]|uniref:UDP-N-acetylmuramate dehydrogenase n=1 Tax=Oceanospirillum maris TaxID=64977 RepID=UPI00041E057B|nr:UDP-N-acetylmuramate dehydrogenase [Oceanospirillum maris]
MNRYQSISTNRRNEIADLAIMFEHHKDLTRFNTLGFTAYAEHFCQPDSLVACQEAIRYAQQKKWPIFALGGGSNLILAADIVGLTLQMANTERDYQPQQDGSMLLRVGAGVTWHDLVMETAEKGLYGLENLALIPGCVGAAPVQNIGAYGVELADCLVAVEGLQVKDGQPVVLTLDECAFGYRDSIFKRVDYQAGGDKQLIITHLQLRLQTVACPVLGYGDLAACLEDQIESQTLTPLAIANAVCTIRQSKLPDPKEIGNAGSFFKNPIVTEAKATALKAIHPELPVYPAKKGFNKLAAGWLIQQSGFKGIRRGCVGVYPKQALVLVHYGQGQASELLALAGEIVTGVEQRFGVVLEREPQVVN